ncbi:hypothetical protein [Streptomyces sp. NPDC005732]|uniref:hypothetical protein n=1 Tax=Streptomyces sp. NPDC005732 TaxID=3157057 RepID=UPI0033FF4B06
MSRALQQQLHARIATAAALLDLPLTQDHLERLAAELTPGIKALLAERDATIAELEPAPYSLTATAVDDGERISREYAGCTLRIHPDVAEDCPAALLGLELQATQSDVLVLDVASATDLTVTVRPRSPEAWTWWRRRFAGVDRRPSQACCATLVGSYGEVRVELRGEGVPELLAQHSANRLQTILAGHPW